jgi:hypothetical protein
MEFATLIRSESAKLEELHAAIDRAFVNRDRDARSRREWETAVRASHAYRSALDPYIERACSEAEFSDSELVEFVICFLESDAWFFRSGYLKQVFITRLKRSSLNEAAKARLRRVLIDAVNRRGTREFKYYCRLAIAVAGPELLAELDTAARDSDDRSRASRASMMLRHIRRHCAEYVAVSVNP